MMHNLSICAIFKDEALYLGEWIDYHLRLGVDHFYLYNNNSRDDYREVLADFSDCVDVYDWPNHPGQLSAYGHCIAENPDSKWVAFIDIDEYLVPVVEASVPAVLEKYDMPHIASLCVFWALFGSDGKAKYDPAPTPLRFKFKVLGRWNYVKSIVRPERIGRNFNRGAGNSPHWFKPRIGKANVDESYRRVLKMNPPDPKTEVIQINHYCTRSKEEWEVKNRKGRADSEVNNSIILFEALHSYPTVEDTKILRFYRKLREEQR